MDHRNQFEARESKATPPALSVVPESLRCHAVDGVALGSRATRTARLADLLARYSPRAGKALLGEGKGGNR